jgi:hypothetical protein
MGVREQRQTISLLTLTGTVKNSLSNTHVTVLIQNASEQVLLCTCPYANLPGSVAGYAAGCLLIDTTNGTLYVNMGNASTADFDAVSVTE